MCLHGATPGAPRQALKKRLVPGPFIWCQMLKQKLVFLAAHIMSGTYSQGETAGCILDSEGIHRQGGRWSPSPGGVWGRGLGPAQAQSQGIFVGPGARCVWSPKGSEGEVGVPGSGGSPGPMGPWAPGLKHEGSWDHGSLF